jgi:hypothetical protein
MVTILPGVSGASWSVWVMKLRIIFCILTVLALSAVAWHEIGKGTRTNFLTIQETDDAPGPPWP